MVNTQAEQLATRNAAGNIIGYRPNPNFIQPNTPYAGVTGSNTGSGNTGSGNSGSGGYNTQAEQIPTRDANGNINGYIPNPSFIRPLNPYDNRPSTDPLPYGGRQIPGVGTVYPNPARMPGSPISAPTPKPAFTPTPYTGGYTPWTDPRTGLKFANQRQAIELGYGKPVNTKDTVVMVGSQGSYTQGGEWITSVDQLRRPGANNSGYVNLALTNLINNPNPSSDAGYARDWIGSYAGYSKESGVPLSSNAKDISKYPVNNNWLSNGMFDINNPNLPVIPPPPSTQSPSGQNVSFSSQIGKSGGAGYTPVIVTNKPSGGATYTPISQDNTTIPVVKGGLEGINSSVNKGMLMQTIETTNGSNQTIQNKKSWIELQRPILEQKDLEIEALVKGNVTGTTWIGSETGYWNVNQKIKEYNELNTEFKANVTQYNIMDAENPQTTTITSIFQNTPTSLTSPSPINNSFEVGIVSKIKDIFGGARNMLAYTPLGATFIGTSQEKEAAYARSAKLNSNLGITVGMVSGGSTPYGYAAEAGYSFLGLKATLASNPVGWGAAIAGTTTFILESTDRLGLLKDTKEYSVRTAGRDFSSWWEGEAFKARFFRDTPLDTFGSSSGLPIMPTNGIGGKSNIKSEPSLTSPIFTSSLMGSGTGTYQGGEVPSQSKSWSEISPFKATYSEKPAYVNPTSEIPVQKRTIVEIFDTGKPQETSNPNKVGWDVNIKNPTKNPNDFIDQYGVSYPNPNKNPTGNPTSYITGNPFKTPNENPNKNPYEYTYPNTFELPNENPTKNPYTSSYLNPNPNVVVFPNKNPYDYNFENPKPEKPPNKDWKIDLPWLPNLNWGGGPRGFGGGSRRGIFAFRENSPAWTPGQMARGIFDIGFSKKTSINTKLGVGVKTPKMNPLKSNIIFKPNKKIKNHTTHISSQMARGIFDIKFKVKKPTSLKIKGISYKKRK